VSTPTQRLSKGVVAVAILALVAACGLPRTGPNKNEIFSGSVLQEGDAFVLTVDDRINQIASVAPSFAFSAGFQDAGLLGSDTIQPGDTLGLTIWENVDDGLLVPAGQNATVLEEVQVDGEGFIFVPYAGRIRAAGNSPEAVRRIISEKLEEQTPDPQVQVARLAGDGSTVSVVGSVGAQGVYPIERPTRTLAAMLAQAGGVTIRPEIAQVTVVRGGHTGTIWFQDLYDHPAHDIALRGGDRIVVEEDTRSFTALGATGTQNRIVFESQSISAIEALAQVGGLSSLFADPTGVFVFRNEPEAIAQQLMGRTDLIGTQRVIYVLDLTRPNGMFMARDFAIRDGDTVYVTEAPYTQFAKVLAAFSGSLVSLDNAAAVGGL
jgi:polysaccharide biosynthesis/export protein